MSLVIYILIMFNAITLTRQRKTHEEFLKVHTTNHPTIKYSTIENVIYRAIDEIRNVMISGMPDIIPSMDPYNTDQIMYSDNITDFDRINLEVSKVMISKLSTFEVQELEIEVMNPELRVYAVKIIGEVQEILIYLKDCDIDIDAFGLNFSRNDDIEIKLIEPKMALELLINFTINLDSLRIHIKDCKAMFSLNDLLPSVVGGNDDPYFDEFLNIYVRSSVLEMIDTFSQDISEIISPILMDTANQVLGEINFIDLLRGVNSL